MTFNLETWKKEATESLRNVRTWLEQRLSQDAPFLLYGSLCSLTLWPLVEAAQEGQLAAAIMALGTVAGGVGANLIAEQVQRWKDKAKEEDVFLWVMDHAENDANVRRTLDEILEGLDVVAKAQVGLNDSDRRWFSATLRKELAQLGNLTRFESMLVDRGVVVGGDVNGDILTDHGQRVEIDTGAVFTVGRDVIDSQLTSVVERNDQTVLNIRGIPLLQIMSSVFTTLLFLQWCSISAMFCRERGGRGDSQTYALISSMFCSPPLLILALYGIILSLSEKKDNRKLLKLSSATALSALVPIIWLSRPLIGAFLILQARRLGLSGVESFLMDIFFPGQSLP